MKQHLTETQSRLYQNILRDLGKISEFLQDDDVNEIMVNSNRKMYIDTASRGLVYIEDVPKDQTLRLIQSLADYSGQTINRTTQYVTLEMPIHGCMNGERFTAQIPPLTPLPSFTLRKKPKVVFPMESYVESGRMTQEQFDSIVEAVQPGTLEDGNVVLDKIYGDKVLSGEMADLSKQSRLSEFPKNVVFCGGPGSGKTAALNSALKKAVELNGNQRWIYIEKAMSEVQCRAENVQQFIANDVISMSKCVEIAMVSRPDRVIIGETKGAETLDMVKIWNTGTPGGMSTVHANNPRECFQRIGDLCMEAGLLTPPWNLIMMTIDVIVWVGKMGSQKGYIREVIFNKGSEHEETKFLEKIKLEKF